MCLHTYACIQSWISSSGRDILQAQRPLWLCKANASPGVVLPESTMLVLHLSIRCRSGSCGITINLVTIQRFTKVCDRNHCGSLHAHAYYIAHTHAHTR